MIENENKSDIVGQLAQSAILKSSIIKRILKSAGLTYIRPIIDPHVPESITYQNVDDFFGTKGLDTEKMLESLVSIGIFNKLLLDVVKTCPFCGSFLIETKEACPRCGSTGITKINDMFRCNTCSESFITPIISLICNKCKKSFDINQARARPLFSYLLIEDARESEEQIPEIELTGRLRFTTPLIKDLKSVFDNFIEKMERFINSYVSSGQPEYPRPYIVKEVEKEKTLLLPSHLEKTYHALKNLGKATATEVAAQTGRTRAMESVYLNQLVTLGLVSKERISKKCYYFTKQ